MIPPFTIADYSFLYLISLLMPLPFNLLRSYGIQSRECMCLACLIHQGEICLREM